MLLPLPDVRIYSLFGIHVHTPLAFHYDVTHLGPSLSSPSVAVWGDGDGVVPLGSLAGCIRCGGPGAHPVVRHSVAHRYSRRAVPLPLPEASHWGILRMPRAVQMVTTMAGWADDTTDEDALVEGLLYSS